MLWRSTGVAITALVALTSGLSGRSVRATSTPPPSNLDGPGTYVLFRTLPSVNPPTAQDNQECDAHFATRPGSVVVLRQAALEFAPRVDRSTGLAVNETASYVGQGYICAGPGLNPDLIDAYAYANLPLGRANAHGTCRVSLPGLVRLAPFIGCRMDLDPIPSLASPGGYAVGNTVSGSIFVGYVARDPTQPLPYTPPPPQPPHTTLPNDPDFQLWRTIAPQSAGTFPECLRAGALWPSGAEKFGLSATQPDLATGVLDPREPTSRIGQVTVCFTGGDAANRTALALVEFPRAGRTVTANAIGDCRTTPLPGQSELLV